MVSKISQSEKDKHDFTHMSDFTHMNKGKKKERKTNQETILILENKLIVTTGEVGGMMGNIGDRN